MRAYTQGNIIRYCLLFASTAWAFLVEVEGHGLLQQDLASSMCESVSRKGSEFDVITCDIIIGIQ